ncbi:MAG: ribbon-helix-helix protein, CopG family [Rhodospirillales bacterium]
MAKETVTFRIEAEARAALDRLAAVLGLDRGDLLNQAVAAYLDVHTCQAAHIVDGLRQADAEEFADEEEVAACWARLS